MPFGSISNYYDQLVYENISSTLEEQGQSDDQDLLDVSPVLY